MLQAGNRFIAVGTTEGVRAETVDGIPPSAPFLAAQCIHFWKTQGREIADFPFEAGGSYYPLEERTFCNEAPPVVSSRRAGPSLDKTAG
jgi:hypothetical protein